MKRGIFVLKTFKKNPIKYKNLMPKFFDIFSVVII